jgi:hypothetical protein
MKQKNFSFRAALAASTLVLATGLGVSTASAATVPAPGVSFSFAQQTVDSGAQPKLTYSSSDLPAGSRIFLEVAYGTPTQWDFLETLKGSAGTTTLQSLPTDLYDFRLVAEQGITQVAVSPVKYLSVVQPSSSNCGACAIIGGVGGGVAGAIVTWLLGLLF